MANNDRNFIYNIVLNVKENVNKQLDGINSKFDSVFSGTRIGNFKAQLVDAFTKIRSVIGVAGVAVSAFIAGIGLIAVGIYKAYDANVKLNKELKQLKQLFKDVDTTTLIDAKNRIQALAESTEEDSKKITIAVNNLAKAYGVTVTKAIEIYEKANRNGANAAGELADSVEEYSIQFKEAGVTIEQLERILSNSTGAGIYKDKLADLVKEINVVSTDIPRLKKGFDSLIGKKETQEQIDLLQAGLISSIQFFKNVNDKAKEFGKTQIEITTANRAVLAALAEDTGVESLNVLNKSMEEGITLTKQQVDLTTYLGDKRNETSRENLNLTEQENKASVELNNSIDRFIKSLEFLVPTITKVKIAFIDFTKSAFDGLASLGNGLETFGSSFNETKDVLNNRKIQSVTSITDSREVAKQIEKQYELRKKAEDDYVKYKNTASGYYYASEFNRQVALYKALNVQFDKLQADSQKRATSNLVQNPTQSLDKSQMNKFRQDSKEIALGISQDRIKAKLDELDALKSLDETQLEQLKDRQDKELALTKELYAKQLAEANLAADLQLANNLKINVNELTKEDRIKSLKEITEISKQETTEQGKAAREQLLIINKSYADSASIRLEQDAKIAEQQRKYDKERLERYSSIRTLNAEIETLGIKEDNTNANALKQQTDNTEKLLELTEQINQNNIKANNLQKLQNDLKLLESVRTRERSNELEEQIRRLDRELADRRNQLRIQQQQEVAAVIPITRTITTTSPSKSRSEIDQLTKKANDVDNIIKNSKKILDVLLNEGDNQNTINRDKLDKLILNPLKKVNSELEYILRKQLEDNLSLNIFGDLKRPTTLKFLNENIKLVEDQFKNLTTKLNQISNKYRSEILPINSTQVITDTIATEAEKQRIRARYTREANAEDNRIATEKSRIIAQAQEQEARNNEEYRRNQAAITAKQREIEIEQTKQNLNDRYQALQKGYDADISLLEAYYNETERLIDTNEDKNNELAKEKLKANVKNIKDILKGDFVKEEGKSKFQSFADNIGAIFENTYTKKKTAIKEVLDLLEEERITQHEINELQSKSAFVNRRASSTKLDTTGLTPEQIREQSDKLFKQTESDYEIIKSIVLSKEGDIQKIKTKFKENGIELSDSELAEFIQYYTKRKEITTKYDKEQRQANMTDTQIRLDNTKELFKKVTEVGQDVSNVVKGVFDIINMEAQLQLAMIQETIAKLDEQINFLNESISESESKLSELKTIFEESTGKRKADALKLYDAETQKLVQLRSAEANLTSQKKTSEEEAKKVQAGIEERGRSLAAINQIVATSSVIAASAGALEKAFTRGATVWDGIAGAVAAIATITSIYASAKSIAKFEDGGLVNGPRHSQGGIPFSIGGSGGYEMEGGEYIMSRKSVDRIGLNNLDKLNFDRSTPITKSPKFEIGGIVQNSISNQSQIDINDRLDLMISQNNALLNKDMYVSVTDVNKTNSIERNRMISSTF